MVTFFIGTVIARYFTNQTLALLNSGKALSETPQRFKCSY